MGRQKAAAVPHGLLESASNLTDETAAQQVITDAEGYLQPYLRPAAGPQRSCSAACTPQKAKSCSSFVIYLLRAAMTQLSDNQPPGLRTATIQLASLGLEALSVLRASLKGKLYEVEMQRYMLLRKLMSLRSYSNAMHQAWLLYMALCCQCWQPLPARPPADCNVTEPLPMADACSNSEIASLVVGTVLNLLLSVVEQGNLGSESIKVTSIVRDHEAIMSWLRLLPEAEQAKHTDTLFRYLFKAAIQALSSDQHFPRNIYVNLCSCTLQACRWSPSHTRLPQVIQKLVQQLPWSDRLQVLERVLKRTDCSGNASETAHALSVLQAVMPAPGCEEVELDAFAALASEHQSRYSENDWLSLLSIITTASQFKGRGKASQCTQDWMPAFQKAIAAVEALLQCLHLEFQSKAKDICHDGANVCQLAHAVLAAISALRKRLHSVATGNSSGAATQWTSVWDEDESRCLCACLMLAAPLAAAATCLQNHITSIHEVDAAQLAPADRIWYPALSAVVTACQIQTAWVIHGAAVEAICPSTVFGCFWAPACVAGYTGARGHHSMQLLPLKFPEEQWACSALFSCAAQLHTHQQFGAAITLFTAACDAAASGLVRQAKDSTQTVQETESHVQSFVKKSQALAGALQQQGRIAAAVTCLGSTVGLLAGLGIAGQSVRPLVQSLVMTRTKLDDDHDTGNHGAAAMKPSGKTGSRHPAKRKVMSKMQAEAATEVPGSAPIAAYLDHSPQAVPADLLGCLVATEAKAVHQAFVEGMLPQRRAEQQGAAVFQHLKQLWPAQAHPVRHAQVLLLQAHLTAPLSTQQIVISLVQQALALLVDQQGADALEAAATAHALWALLTAEQRRFNYCEAANEHTSPSTGSKAASNQSPQPTDTGSARAGSKQSAKGRKGSGASADREGAWQHCMEHAHEAVQAWQGYLHAHAAEGGCIREGLADEATLLQLMLELLYMVGLHGHDKLQCQLAELMGAAGAGSSSDDVMHALGNTPSSSLLAWALAPCMCQSVLPVCEAPSPQLAHSLHSAYRVVAPADTLQQMAHDLAASKQGKSAQVVWSRALLHQLAAQAQIQEGLTIPCLYNASEALRLGSSLCSLMPSGTAAPTPSPSQPSALPLNPSTGPRDVPDSSAESLEDPDTSSAQGPGDATMQGTNVSDNRHEAADAAADAAAKAAARARTKAGAADQTGVDGVGYWQVAWLYLTSLLKLGEAYEVAGSHEDAVHAFKEGLELASRCGAGRLASIFRLRAAEVAAKRHAWPQVEEVLCILTHSPVTGMPKGNNVMDSVVAMSIARLQGLCAQHRGSNQDACVHFEEGITTGRKALATEDQPGMQWLVQDLVANLRLALAHTHDCMGNKKEADGLISLTMAELQHLDSKVTQQKGTKHQAAQSSNAKPASSSTGTQHFFTAARACLVKAKLKNTSCSSAAAGSVMLAGCGDSLTQRRLSHTSASTSQGVGTQKAGAKDSRAGRPGRGVRGTARSTRNTRGRAALTVEQEADSQSQLGAGQDADKDRLVVLDQAELLLQAYHASHGHPILHREITMELSQCCSQFGLVHAAVLLQHASLGASLSLQYRSILHSKLFALDRRRLCGSATAAAEQACAMLQKAVGALETGLLLQPMQPPARLPGHCQRAMQDLEEQASNALEASTQLLPQATITSLSLTHSSAPSSTTGTESQACRHCLTITRYDRGSAPILMTVPICSQAFQYDCNIGAEPNSSSEQAGLGGLEEFDSIMADSARSMKAEVPLLTPADKAAWWRQRLVLNERMAALLHHFSHHWLGPWKVLLFGAPADSRVAEALSQAALGVFQSLPRHSSASAEAEACPGSLQGLLRVVMWGAASLTNAELADAASQILQLAGQPVDDVMVAELSQHIRSEFQSVCGSPDAQPGTNRRPETQVASALSESTNLQHTVRPNATRPKASAPSTDQHKGKARGSSGARGLQTTGKQSTRPSRFATMQAAATAAPARRPPPTLDVGTPSIAAACSSKAQDPALVSQLQARFDALAIEESQLQGSERQHQRACGDGKDGQPMAVLLDHLPTLLVLDGELQRIPWESMPALKQQRMYRIPSLACAAAVAARQISSPADVANQAVHTATTVDMSSTVYMVNPAGDLSSTQATFEETFKQQDSWQGTAGTPLAPGQLAAALQGHEMFLYFGHGSGDQYLSARTLRRMPCCASALLMGCSSGSLKRAGQYEASGPVLAYLMAGCPVAVANLWDVTDRDIDRFSEAVLARWLGQDFQKTTLKQPLCADQSVCVSTSITNSRTACRLTSLIGAAPVCYGIPVSVSWLSQSNASQ